MTYPAIIRNEHGLKGDIPITHSQRLFSTWIESLQDQVLSRNDPPYLFFDKESVPRKENESILDICYYEPTWGRIKRYTVETDLERTTAESRLQERRERNRQNRILELNQSVRALTKAVTGEREGSLSLHEHCLGRITRIIDDDVIVVYITQEGELEQLYDRNQFKHPHAMKAGDIIETHSFAWITPKNQETPTGILTPEEREAIRDASNRRPTGPIEI